ncbi:hypothetical protein FGO68_gene6733 [Halteria grandinella]|uniref:Uncharacterized protein n=1 Tax=Halteria grandinella TaxID=5974 RepID=A0A8J8P582_HALGN|nr:hypothetical protein FGO68_gene6733 [Halteria grandinella]
MQGTLILTTLLCLVPFSQLACTPAQQKFPKIVGGMTDQTYFTQLDYSAKTDTLVAVGWSQDQGLRGDTLGPVTIPIVIAYTSGEYMWGKSVSTMAGKSFKGVKINKHGTKAVVCSGDLTPRIIIVIDLVDGSFLSANQVNMNFQYYQQMRNMLLLDTDEIIMADGQFFIKMLYNQVTRYTFSTTQFYAAGINTANGQKFMHVYSFDQFNRMCAVTVISWFTFTPIYQKQIQCSSLTFSEFINQFQAGYYQSDVSIGQLAFQEGTKFFRLKNEYAVPPTYTTSMAMDSSSSGLATALGLYCVNYDLFYSLMYGSIGSNTNQLWIAEVNFAANTITYRGYLYQIPSPQLGVIFASNNFYVPMSDATISTSNSNMFVTGTPLGTANILSLQNTCQQANEYVLPTMSLIADANIFQNSAISLTNSTFPAIEISSTIGTPTNIVSSLFENQFTSECQTMIPVAPHDYIDLKSDQPTNNLYYVSEELSKTFTITPFTATKVLNGGIISNPQFTYSLGGFNGPLNSVTVSNSNGEINIPSIQSLDLGNFTVVVVGILQDCQAISATFKLIGQVNMAPLFDNIVDHFLSAIEICQGDTTIYQLPVIIDPNLGQSVDVIIIDPSSLAFVTFTDATKTAIKISPKSAIAPSDYPITIQLFDGIEASLYSLTITVLPALIQNSLYNISNAGPPTFSSPLTSLTFAHGQTAKYKLPPYADPDGEKVALSVALGDAIMIAIYDPNNQEFTFNTQQASKAQYQIFITLTDDNVNPQSTKYRLDIFIKNLLQPQNGNNSNLDDPLNQQVVRYQLSRATRDGQIKLYFTGQPRYVSAQLGRQLNETDFRLTLNSKDNVNFTFIFDENQQSQGYLLILMEFDLGSPISLYDDPLDWVEFKAIKKINIIVAKSNYTIKKFTRAQIELPNQYSSEVKNLIKDIQQIASRIQIGLIPGGIITNIFFKLLLNLIWGILNDLSFMMNMTLISISIPGIASPIMNIVLQFIYLDLLQTDQWLNPFLSQEKVDDEYNLDDEPLNENFDQQGFQSMYAFKNLGSTLIFTIIMISLFASYFTFAACEDSSPLIGKLVRYLRNMLFWNSSFRFIIQQFQPLLISSLINMYSLGLETKMANFSALFSISMLIILPLSIWKMQNYVKVENPDNLKRNSAPLIEGINTLSGIGRYWMPLTLMKWTSLSLILVILRDYPYFQLMALSAITFLFQILLIIGKPLATSSENKMSLFNELMASNYLYVLFTLTDLMGRNQLKEECGFAMVIIVAFTISVNILKVLIQASQSLFQGFRRKTRRPSQPSKRENVVKLRPTDSEIKADQLIAKRCKNIKKNKTVKSLTESTSTSALDLSQKFAQY